MFATLNLPSPPTYGIKYAGSKLKLIPHILELARPLGVKRVLDGFSGTTRVSQALAQSAYSVISNDRAEWSRVFGVCFLLNRQPKSYFQPLIDELNALPGMDGWFTENYGGDGNKRGEKKPWQYHNTRKIDAVREKIDEYRLSDTEKCVLLASLMLAMDEVESTLGHFCSYLNEWSPRSYQTMHLKVPEFFFHDGSHAVWQRDVFDILPNVEADLAYFDPPYGSNNEKMPPSRVRYAGYYHIWKTVVLNDRPSLFGRAGRRKDSSDAEGYSPFEDFRKDETGKFIALNAVERMLEQTRARYVLLSYGSGGRATADELMQSITNVGALIKFVKVDYKKNVMAEMKWTREWVSEQKPYQEYLFLMEK